jgi:hypothetical protein
MVAPGNRREIGTVLTLDFDGRGSLVGVTPVFLADGARGTVGGNRRLVRRGFCPL